MRDPVTVRTNIPDFRRQLAEVGRRIERNLVRRAIRAAGAVFRDEARRIAPTLKGARKDRISGALKRAIIVKGRRAPPGTVMVTVGLRKGSFSMGRGNNKNVADAFYGRFLEEGWIPRGRGNRFRGGRSSRALQRYRALRGGARRVQYPFLAPAFSNRKMEALDAFRQTMSQGLAAEVRSVR